MKNKYFILILSLIIFTFGCVRTGENSYRLFFDPLAEKESMQFQLHQDKLKKSKDNVKLMISSIKLFVNENKSYISSGDFHSISEKINDCIYAVKSEDNYDIEDCEKQLIRMDTSVRDIISSRQRVEKVQEQNREIEKLREQEKEVKKEEHKVLNDYLDYINHNRNECLNFIQKNRVIEVKSKCQNISKCEVISNKKICIPSKECENYDYIFYTGVRPYNCNITHYEKGMIQNSLVLLDKDYVLQLSTAVQNNCIYKSYNSLLSKPQHIDLNILISDKGIVEKFSFNEIADYNDLSKCIENEIKYYNFESYKSQTLIIPIKFDNN